MSSPLERLGIISIGIDFLRPILVYQHPWIQCRAVLNYNFVQSLSSRQRRTVMLSKAMASSRLTFVHERFGYAMAKFGDRLRGMLSWSYTGMRIIYGRAMWCEFTDGWSALLRRLIRGSMIFHCTIGGNGCWPLCMCITRNRSRW